MSQSPINRVSIRLDLSTSEILRLDTWIASKQNPRPSRAGALRHLVNLGLDHGREVEITREHIAKADHDIRERFDQLVELLNLAAASAADVGEGQKRN